MTDKEFEKWRRAARQARRSWVYAPNGRLKRVWLSMYSMDFVRVYDDNTISAEVIAEKFLEEFNEHNHTNFQVDDFL